MTTTYWTITHKWLETMPNTITSHECQEEEIQTIQFLKRQSSEQIPHQRQYTDGKLGAQHHMSWGEFQIKTRYHYTPIRIANIQNTDIKCWRNMEQQKLSISDGGYTKQVQPLWKTGSFLKKTKHTLTIHWSNQAPCYIPKLQVNVDVQLLIIAKT